MNRPFPGPAHPPTATYRLQLHAGFDLDAATGVLDRLDALGVSHVYLSPVLTAVPGSTHGYDVVDHATVSAELGGAAAWDRFCERAAALGLGVVVDVVPNHVSIAGGHNRRWLDVLAHGPSSSSAEWFDIDWVGREDYQLGVVLLPVLGDLYGEVLAAGELVLVRDGVDFAVEAPGHRFPLAPRSLPLVLRSAVDVLRRSTADDDDDDGRSGDQGRLADRLAFVSDTLAELAPGTTDAGRRRRAAHLDALLELLDGLLDRPAVAQAVDGALAAANVDPDAVHAVLEEQHHRLTFWRTGATELDYRRFFDITTLVAIRIERGAVFDAVHELPLRWLAEGRIQGLRIDHPDGLADPAGYVHRLRAAAPDAWIVVEKILEGDEALPETWPVDGTTGYEAMRLVDGLLVDPAGLEALAAVESAVHDRCGTVPPDPDDVVDRSKRQAVTELLAPELERVVDLALQVAERRPLHRDHPRPDVRAAIAALAVAFDVYRTYVVPGEDGASSDVPADDVARIDAAVARARADGDIDPRLLGFLGDVLCLRDLAEPERGPSPEEAELVIRFQQLSGPATAKGLEDTAWYRLARHIGSAEVGADPRHPTVDLDAFHAACMRRQQRWPATMTTRSTHDTKRSGDVRARLAALGEPGLEPSWPELADRWIPRLQEVWPDEVAADAPTLLIALQTMLGAWPLDAERLGATMTKAIREAKARTTWTDQDPAFEDAVARVAALVDDPAVAADLAADVAGLARAGMANTLVQTAISLLQPGVPDVYQGTETLDLSLVDPDNRRPVDHDALAAAQVDLDPADPVTTVDAEAKLALTAAALRLRRRRPETFGEGPSGAHRRLPATGPDADRIVAFARGEQVCVVAVRFPTRGPVAEGTGVELPDGVWSRTFGGGPATVSGGTVPVADLLGPLPVAVLEVGT